MAVVVVLWPMMAYSASATALAAPVGIRHVVMGLVDKTMWTAPGVLTEIEAAKTACGSRIAFTLKDEQIRRGRARPSEMCKKCANAKPREMEAMIGVNVSGSHVVPGQDASTGQGTLLS